MKLRFTSYMAAVVLAALPITPTYGAMGDLKWSFPFGVTSDSSAALYFDGTKTNLYVGANDGKMYAFDLNPGSSGTLTPKWTFQVPNGPFGQISRVRSSATINKTGDRIYFGANDGKVYCLNVSGATPVQVWTYTARPNSTIESTPALQSLTGSELYVTASDGFLYAIDINSGLANWEFQLSTTPITGFSGEPLGSPAVGSDGTIYASSGTGNKLFAITSAGGSAALKWSIDFGVGTGPVTVGPDGTIYVPVGHGVQAVNPDGTIKWTKPTGADVKMGVISESGGNVFFGADDFNIYSLKPDGSQLAAPIATGSFVCGAGIIAADGKIWVPSTDGRVYVLNANGTLFNSFPLLGSGVVYSSLAIGPNGHVYAVDGGGTLQALEGSGQPMAAGFWPNWRMNNRHVADVRNNRWTESAIGTITIIEINALYPNGTDRGSAYAINDVNKTVGQNKGIANYGTPYAGYSERAFSYSPATDLGSLNGYLGYSAAFAVNNANQYAGWTQYGSSSTYRAFRYIGTMTALTPLTGYANSYAYGIAGDGAVVGISQNSGAGTHATKWLSGSSTPTDLLAIPRSFGDTTYVWGINNQGKICGKAVVQTGSGATPSHGFISPAATLVQGSDIGSFAGDDFNSEALALDGSGQIVGNTQISSTVTRPFLKRTWNGTWIFPSSMPPTLDGNWATARAINDRGQIVGEAKDFSNNSRAFIWIPYLQNITDLNSYLSASQQLSWTLLAAYGINDQGRIVGWAAKKSNNVFQYYIPFLLYPN